MEQEVLEEFEEINMSEYSSGRDLLVAEVLYPHGKTARAVCRKRKGHRKYEWFIDDQHHGMGLIHVSGMGGDSLAEAQSEFELYFGVEYPDDYKVKADWYRYKNTW